MVQRIGGKDSPPAEAPGTQGSKRQDDRAAPERAEKFRSMLGKGGQEEGAAARPNAPASGPGGPQAAGTGGQMGGPQAAKMGAPQDERLTGLSSGGRPGQAGAAEIAAAARDMQAIFEEMGAKTHSRLGKGNTEESSGEGDAAALAQMAAAGASTAWSRPEGPSRVEETSRAMPMELEGMERMHRLLIGQGPAGAEARLAITDGPLAGAQIHLRTGPGGVQASVSTTTESSRQTLVTAMEEVARRLRDKGHRLTLQVPPPPPSPTDRWQQQRG